MANYDPEAVQRLRERLNLHAPAAQALASRGYLDVEEARRFLHPRLDDLHDPSLLHGLSAAVDRLHHALQRHERILLYGDYDVDGTTSVVILRKALELAGGHVSHYVPHRLKEGYGMRTDVMDRAASEGVKLVVSVDTGIRAAEVVRHAAALGIDVIITDHHLPEEDLPPALAVLNPNQPDCLYPDKNLCGAGVTFKLVQGLLRRLGWPADRVRRLEESFLKMVAVATVADVVPLLGENRIIVKHGLSGFRDVKNPGLRALLEVSGIAEGTCPSASQVAFRLAPRINAAGRMANADDVITMFLTADPAQAKSLASQLHDLNQERQQTEAEIIALILEECEQVPVTDAQAALVFSGKGWHRGVLGIVASRLVERFCRPAFVLGEEEGEVSGSGRSVPSFHLLESMESMKELFSRFGGHKMAAGLAMPADRLEEFRRRLNAFAAERLSDDDRRPMLELDGELELRDVHERSVMEVLGLAPFGAGNKEPQFGIRSLEVAQEPQLFGEKHLRVTFVQNGRVMKAKAWNFLERASELQPGSLIDAVVTFEDDPYSAARGYPPWGVQIKDIRPAQSLP